MIKYVLSVDPGKATGVAFLTKIDSDSPSVILRGINKMEHT
jgi:hypothetical protein